MKFIEKRYYFYFLSLFLILFGALSFYLFNPDLGIDLIGGQILEVKTNADVPSLIQKLNLKATYFKTQDGYLIKSQENLNNLWSEIQKADNQSQKIKFERISSSLSSELRNKAFLMIIFVLLAIGIYIALAFRKLKNQFSLLTLSFIVIVTLFHDVLGTIGFYVLFSKIFNFELDLKFITALLILIGYSVHDTIVVFDRLRENILKTKKKTPEIFNQSIQETIRRSLFTSITTILAILPLSILISDLRAFLFSIQIGIIIGTYSSICLAAPLLYDQR